MLHCFQAAPRFAFVTWLLCTIATLTVHGVSAQQASVAVETENQHSLVLGSAAAKAPATSAAMYVSSYGVRQPRETRIGVGLGTSYLMRESKLGSGAFVRPSMALSIYGRQPVGRRLTVGLDLIGQHRPDALRRGAAAGLRPGRYVHFQSFEATASVEFLFDNRIVDAYLLGGAQGLIAYRQQLSDHYFNTEGFEPRFFNFYDEVRRVRPFVGARISKEIADYVYFDVHFRVVGPERFTHADGQEEDGVQFVLRAGVSLAL